MDRSMLLWKWTPCHARFLQALWFHFARRHCAVPVRDREKMGSSCPDRETGIVAFTAALQGWTGSQAGRGRGRGGLQSSTR